MLTWTSVVTDAPDDQEIAMAIARRTALEIRPLIEFAPLRRAMGLEIAVEAEFTPSRPTKSSPAKRAAAKRRTARSPKRHHAKAAVAAGRPHLEAILPPCRVPDSTIRARFDELSWLPRSVVGGARRVEVGQQAGSPLEPHASLRGVDWCSWEGPGRSTRRVGRAES